MEDKNSNLNDIDTNLECLTSSSSTVTSSPRSQEGEGDPRYARQSPSQAHSLDLSLPVDASLLEQALFTLTQSPNTDNQDQEIVPSIEQSSSLFNHHPSLDELAVIDDLDLTMSDSSSNHGNINFSDWQLPATRSKSQCLPKCPRTSTPRVEKGTRKVNEHENKEKASKLLYALLPSGDPTFTDHMTTQIDQVVSDFGLDTARLKTEGTKYRSTVIDHLERAQKVAELEKKYKELGSALKGLRKSSGGLEVSSSGSGSDSDSGEAPSTRAGGGQSRKRERKREREVSEFGKCLDELNIEFKRVKGGG